MSNEALEEQSYAQLQVGLRNKQVEKLMAIPILCDRTLICIIMRTKYIFCRWMEAEAKKNEYVGLFVGSVC